MSLRLSVSKVITGSKIQITGSKSESNRLLILKGLYPNIRIQNLSNSDDTEVMSEALMSNSDKVDIHHAGTAMRFLTAYFSLKEGRNVLLTGSDRMKERPIAILVSALKDLGADIEYLENDGCPPLQINGKSLTKSRVALDANVSSQYISALMLIAPQLPNGLELYLKGKITSVPYINMTLQLLSQLGIECSFVDNTINISPKSETENLEITVESDWSSASYFYSIVALSEAGTTLRLSSYKLDSLQGDSVLAEIYKRFNVETTFFKNSITIKKLLGPGPQRKIVLDLANAPDIAQTIAVTCLGLGLACELSGLHTLKIKETDRLLALKTEIEKLGGSMNITVSTLTLYPCSVLNKDIEIETYNDHRMAMAFAPLALVVPILIKDSEVVSKSYPQFWNDLKHIGFAISK